VPGARGIGGAIIALELQPYTPTVGQSLVNGRWKGIFSDLVRRHAVGPKFIEVCPSFPDGIDDALGERLRRNPPLLLRWLH